VLSRGLSIAVLLAVVNAPVRGSQWTQLVHRWDGDHYLIIARDGYRAVEQFPTDWPFFPGYALLIRALGAIGPDDVFAFVANQLLLLVALGGVYTLARRHASERASELAVWCLCFFPASFVFSMNYPSALFLAASVWAFILVEDRHDLAAGALAACAAIARPNGVIVAVAVATAARSWRRLVPILLPSAAVLGVWLWYCYEKTGDAFVFVTMKHHWDELTVVGLLGGSWKWPAALPHLSLALLGLGAVLVQRRRLPVSWLVLTVLSLVPPLATGILGMARYTNECFPPFVAAGQILERRPTKFLQAALAVSALGLVVMAVLVARYSLLP
jgi:hypothetical protein